MIDWWWWWLLGLGIAFVPENTRGDVISSLQTIDPLFFTHPVVVVDELSLAPELEPEPEPEPGPSASTLSGREDFSTGSYADGQLSAHQLRSKIP